jgi:hypothetical protein
MGKPLSEEHKQKLREAAKRRTPEQEARRVAALREAKKTEDPSYRQTDEYKEKQRQATKKKWKSGTYEGRAKKTAATRANWTDEQKAELSRKMSEAKRQEWAKAKAEGRRRNRHYGTRKRTSRHELALVPYMVALGFQHDTGKRIGHKIPDFVDEGSKRIYEYFGTYWHPDRDEERRITEFYAQYGWECCVLWEHDLFDWLRSHQSLVTEQEHSHAWKIAHVNNGYAKPVSTPV